VELAVLGIADALMRLEVKRIRREARQYVKTAARNKVSKAKICILTLRFFLY
jgi:hypothetical protein